MLADGSVVDTDDDKELLWASGGAGTGTLGVVVGLRIKGPRVPQAVRWILGISYRGGPNCLLVPQGH